MEPVREENVLDPTIEAIKENDYPYALIYVRPDHDRSGVVMCTICSHPELLERFGDQLKKIHAEGQYPMDERGISGDRPN